MQEYILNVLKGQLQFFGDVSKFEKHSNVLDFIRRNFLREIIYDIQ